MARTVEAGEQRTGRDVADGNALVGGGREEEAGEIDGIP